MIQKKPVILSRINKPFTFKKLFKLAPYYTGLKNKLDLLRGQLAIKKAVFKTKRNGDFELKKAYSILKRGLTLNCDPRLILTGKIMKKSEKQAFLRAEKGFSHRLYICLQIKLFF